MAKKIILEGDIVIKTIEEKKKQLISALNGSSDLEIEFKNINKWDVSGIRLMYAFKEYCKLMNRNVSFKFASEAESSIEWIELLNNH